MSRIYKYIVGKLFFQSLSAWLETLFAACFFEILINSHTRYWCWFNCSRYVTCAGTNLFVYVQCILNPSIYYFITSFCLCMNYVWINVLSPYALVHACVSLVVALFSMYSYSFNRMKLDFTIPRALESNLKIPKSNKTLLNWTAILCVVFRSPSNYRGDGVHNNNIPCLIPA